ncbi:type II toxin-antitoxin system RelE/ParE family toxin [Cognatiyoonia sp. IB215446]|uniref:type II toxin-antitoxin system RelE/ParE family toxin n=1 Tax=Cognatiyoonia sp. IB215446 TaxID=3097355 RepID=UPI002A114BB0|nr:type II toxin-antitoxin system RelE/ParE family toxin [Cognatiyoonia sp. IB215446]MDX8346456.1 type II toxin-antitoxin system RelE/ParE family toxin [Cognatiyoonia sp. IB215446]
MKRIKYARAAVEDIATIWDYTEDHWGYAQAVTYDAMLEERILGIATGEVASRSAYEVRPGLRRVLTGRHVVFFREDDTAVTVIRILHQRMDVQRL